MKTKVGPLISIIIPVYNTEKYLEICLDSVTKQTYNNLDIIIVDDGSTDKSPLIIAKYAKKDKRIRFVSQKNGGVSIARNTGLSLVKGEYISIIDADDFLEYNAYEIIVNNIVEHNPNAVLFSTNYLDSKKKRWDVEGSCDGQITYLGNNIQIMELYLEGHSLSVCNYVFKKSVLKGLEFQKDMRIKEDSLFALEALLRSETEVVVSTPLYNYWHHAVSATRKFVRGDIESTERYINTLIKEVSTKKYAEIHNLLDQRVLTHYLDLLILARKGRDKKYTKLVRENIRQTKSRMEEGRLLGLKNTIKYYSSFLPLWALTMIHSIYKKTRGLK